MSAGTVGSGMMGKRECWACMGSGKLMLPNPRKCGAWDAQTCYVCLGTGKQAVEDVDKSKAD
jgi:hypothetical protein